jgi:hypothetical protein
MQFSIVSIVSLVAISASAAPSYLGTRATSQADIDGAKDIIAKVQAGCSIGKCVAALAPSVVSCAAAAAEEGLNPIADAVSVLHRFHRFDGWLSVS